MTDQAAWQRNVDWLFQQQRFGVKPGLARVQALLARLGSPQQTFETVLVGGTNVRQRPLPKPLHREVGAPFIESAGVAQVQKGPVGGCERLGQ